MERTLPMAYWLMKSEPFKYSWDDLVAEGEGTWDGVRNYLARNNLQAMEVGDEAFFYHSREGLEIVGICTVSVAGIGDPTDDTGRWAAVKIKPKESSRIPLRLLRSRLSLGWPRCSWSACRACRCAG